MPLEPFDVIAQHLHSVADFVRWGASRLHEAEAHFGHGTDNAVDESAALVLFAVGLPHDAPARLFDGRLTPGEKRRAWELIERRIRERKPAAYLTGEAWFAGLRFKVNEHVLVPRSPLAESIEARFAPWIDADAVARVLDLGTGSGCIAIACARALPDAAVDASDVSEAALALAAENVALHRVGDRVRLVRSDVFEALAGERYDLIVSNPPYVDAGDMAVLPDEYRHEPALGLAAGADGLAVVMRILRDAASHLTGHGILICETGNSAAALEARCTDVPFTWIEFERGEGEVFVLSRDELVRHAAAFA